MFDRCCRSPRASLTRVSPLSPARPPPQQQEEIAMTSAGTATCNPCSTPAILPLRPLVPTSYKDDDNCLYDQPHSTKITGKCNMLESPSVAPGHCHHCAFCHPDCCFHCHSADHLSLGDWPFCKKNMPCFGSNKRLFSESLLCTSDFKPFRTAFGSAEADLCYKHPSLRPHIVQLGLSP